MLRIDTRPRHRNSGRPPEKSAPAFLQWLRGRRCCVCASETRIEACHVDYAGDKGMGTKVSDRWAIPMCATHHAESHSAGWKTFEARHNLNGKMIAEAFWRMWPGRRAWQARFDD